jgi:dynactin complex subunit
MTVLLKVKKINLLLSKTLWIYKNKDSRFVIRCAIKFYINMITTVVVWWQLFLLKKWTKVGAKFFI